jgi:hypothetical protein
MFLLDPNRNKYKQMFKQMSKFIKLHKLRQERLGPW